MRPLVPCLVVLALLALPPLTPPASARLPGAVALAAGSGNFVDLHVCSSPATFVVEIGQGVGTLRWVSDCPDVTGSANFVLVCDTDCDLPPYCGGDPRTQWCEYREEGTGSGMTLTLARSGAFHFQAEFPGRVLRANGQLAILSWPLADPGVSTTSPKQS